MIPRLLFLLLIAASLQAQTPRLDQIDLLRADWPRVFFFRAAEGTASRPHTKYEEWDQCFSRLMGIEGKALDEELKNRSLRSVDFFSRFKEAHPHQLVLEHYNGFSRDPMDAGSRYFAGHWLYFGGTKIESDVPAQAGETVIDVSEVRRFKMEMGRTAGVNDDIALCELDANGKPDWTKCEQVRLLELKPGQGRRGSIRVARGQYGTQPRALAKGRGYAAAHVADGPWGAGCALLWGYNLATTCPRDAAGRSCADVLADDLAREFADGGRLQKFDGLEFDVMRNALGGRIGGLRIGDTDADGVGDAGVVAGRNVYGEGVIQFCQKLRERLGVDRLIMADGWSADLVRAFGTLNGMESEGYPFLGDATLNDWSGGLNRAAFWTAHSAPPRWNYINHKFIESADQKAPWSYHRLVFAAAMMTDSAICSSLAPPVAEKEFFGIWDEWQEGAAHKLGWLGQPKAPPRHLAYASSETIGGLGDQLMSRVDAGDAKVELVNGALSIQGRDGGQDRTSFRLRAPVRANGELLLRFTARGAQSKVAPAGLPRALRAGLADSSGKLSSAWLDGVPMDYTFYATGLPTDQEASVTFEIEGSEPWAITSLAAYAQADVMVREYEHGVALANPSAEPCDIDLAKLFPSQKLRRLQGTPLQDPKTNNGEAAAGQIKLPPRDGLFLVKE